MTREQTVQVVTPTSVSAAATHSCCFDLSFVDAARHLLHVDLWIRTQGASALELVFPVWTPGSYMIREYARNVEALIAERYEQAHSAALGQAEVEHLDKHRWLVQTGGAEWVCIRYRLYCREMSVRTNWIEKDFGFITGAAAFPFVRGREDRPIMLRLTLPAEWTNVAGSLLRKNSADPTITELWADDYDDLVDSPIVCGKLDVTPFEVGGKEHYLVNCGAGDLWDSLKAVADVERIVAEHQQFWGTIPYDRYWFLNLITEAGGGLEHDNSCVLMTGRWAMRKRESYLNWLALVSHEFFHTWNVRRLRPRALMHYDYEREQYLKELWIAEGVTSYFDDLALVRVGLCSREEYLQRLSKNIATVQGAPGRRVQSLDESSWDTWIKHYRPDENSQNARISYYIKGMMVAWLLDAALQQQTDRRVTLDDVMRTLWHECSETGYTHEQFCSIVDRISGRPMSKWLNDCVLGTDELDFTDALEWFGLRFKVGGDKPNTDRLSAGAERFGDAWLGCEASASEGRLWVRRVMRGGPADTAGLNVDDELIALDGYRLEATTWPDRLTMYRPGDALEMVVSRRGKLQSLHVVLGKKSANTWQLEVSPAASSQAEANLRAWLRS